MKTQYVQALLIPILQHTTFSYKLNHSQDIRQVLYQTNLQHQNRIIMTIFQILLPQVN